MKNRRHPIVEFCLLTSALCIMFHAPCASAAGMASQHSLTAGTVELANTQKRSSWVPVALLFRFDDPATGTITVERRSGSTAFLLASCTVSGNRYAVWVPAAAIAFNENESLIITSTVTNGTVEIIRKGE